MCGVAGVVGAGFRDVDAILSRMNAAQQHRGPDGEGIRSVHFGAGIVGLAHRRLAILDLSVAGWQPMEFPGSGDLLVFNGEIYNSPRLREELIARGFCFRGHSDTEVLLTALHCWGEEALSRLEGMFAFAYLDRKRARLMLARDPLGIKPLYVARAGAGLVFASEVRAILASDFLSPQLDESGMASLLAYGSVQEPLSLFKGISSFPAGHYMWLSLQGDGGVKVSTPERYWRWPAPDHTLQGGEPLILQTRARLESAVRGHLLSDVPVGVFLSSGVDSTLVASLARQYSDRLRSFTVGFSDDLDHDESDLAEKIAKHLGLKHETLLLKQSDALDQVSAWLNTLDQPSMDGLNTFIISRYVRALGVPVALSGQGGDELFGGYPSFEDIPRLSRMLHLTDWIPLKYRYKFASLAGAWRSEAFRDKSKDMITGGSSLLPMYLQRRRSMSNQQMCQLGFSDKTLGGHAIEYCPIDGMSDLPWSEKDPVHAVSLFESRCYLGSTLLHVGDNSGMANGLEIRVPFLDLPLLDFALSIPGVDKLPSGRANKHLLREAFPDLLPPELWSAKKRGFVLPIGRWLLGPLRDLAENSITTLCNLGDIDPKGVDAVWQQFLRAPESQAWSRAWTLVVLGHYLGTIRS